MVSNSGNLWTNLNRAVEAWTLQTWKLQSAALQRAIKNGTDYLVGTLKYNTRSSNGLIERSGFTFDRTGIYLAKGVGGIYKINPEGSGIVVRTTPGPFRRKAADWLSPVMEERVPMLSAIVSEEFAKVAGETIANAMEVKTRGFK